MEIKKVIEKMKQIEKEIPISIMDVQTNQQWEVRWVRLLCWLEMYEE